MSVAPGPPWVDPATIPELMEILRRRLLSKVRIFECWCENGDRLLQVIKVQRRPLALAQTMTRVLGQTTTLAATGLPDPTFRPRKTHAVHRSNCEAAWLDLNRAAYSVPVLPGHTVARRPYLLSAQCQHETLSVPLIWLREQVEAGVSKCVITEAVRREMGAGHRGW